MTYQLSKELFNRTKEILRKGTIDKTVKRLHQYDKVRNFIYRLKNTH